MGSENSKSGPQRQGSGDNCSAAEIAVALDNQRSMYEAKYDELRRAYLQNQAILRRNQLAQNNSSGHPSTPLYPNLNNINNNMQRTAAYSPSSTSITSSPSYGPSTSNGPSPSYGPSTSHGPSTSNGPSTSHRPSTSNGPSTSHGPSTSNGPSASYRSNTSSGTVPSYPSQPIPSAPPPPMSPMTETCQRNPLPTSKQPSSNSTRNIRPKNTAQSIVDCVTCSNGLGDQIYQCKNGHSSCKECRLNKTQCGVCSQMITAMRNITLEATLADIKPITNNNSIANNNSNRMKCPNFDGGCRAFIQKIELTEHLKECPFKVMTCASIVMGNCTWKGKLNQLVDHFNELHKEHREADVDKEMSLSNITEQKQIVYLVNLGNFNFLVHIQINSQRTLSMTVQLIGTKFVASKWTYEIHIYSKRDPHRRYKYIDTCHSHAESVKEIFDTGNCAVLSTNYAKTFLSDKLLYYKFFIRREYDGKNNRRN